MERRLAAILAADVAGFSRLVGSDEEGTLTAFKKLRREKIEPLVARYHGRVVKLIGDGLLVEFQSAVDAVRCAVNWQTVVAEDGGGVSLQFRIGVNIGDIVIDGYDIFGDGVNVAARLESVADIGGITISDSVHQHVKAKLNIEFRDDGVHELKNIREPVRVWKWVGGQTIITDQNPALRHPEKPTIAVLPFANMSGDTEQVLFSDGITEDVITELSRFPILYVIARQSTFSLKNQQLGIREIGARLGADYVVEGSFRRSGNKVRMTVLLVEAHSGRQIWAERYDRDFEDIFDVQDDLTRSIVAAISAQLGETVLEKAARKHPSSIRAYEYFLQANRHYYRFNPDDNIAAARQYQQAIEQDSRFARAYAGLANAYTTDHFLDWRRAKDALENSLNYSRKCLSLDNRDILGRAILSWALIGCQRWEEAELELDRVLAMKTGDADMLAEVGHGLFVVGRKDIGIALLDDAVRLNPLSPDVYRRWLGIGYYRAHRYKDAATALRVTRLEGWGKAWLSAAFARLGEADLAKEALDGFLSARRAELEAGGADARGTERLLGNYRNNFRYESEWQHFLQGLIKAGLQI